MNAVPRPHSPSITIGLMTHNYGHFIREAVESVLAQTRQDWELVISDDVSTDDTAQVVAPYLSDPRIRYVRHETNLRQAGNWSYVLGQGTAPVVAVLHADDKWLPETLATVLPHFEADPELDFLYGNWWVLEGEKPLRLGLDDLQPALRTGLEEIRHQVTRHHWRPTVAFARRAVLDEAGRPDPDLHMVIDTEYFLRVASHARRIRTLAEPVAVYREHGGSTSVASTANGRFVNEVERLPGIVASRLGARPELREAMAALTAAAARALFNEGVTLHVLEERAGGNDLMRRAIRLDRGVLKHPKRLADYLLARLGKPASGILRSLHRVRLDLKEEVKEAYLSTSA